MNQALKNKEFIIEYFNALSGKVKTKEIMARYISDQSSSNTSLFSTVLSPNMN